MSTKVRSARWPLALWIFTGAVLTAIPLSLVARGPRGMPLSVALLLLSAVVAAIAQQTLP